MLQWIIGSILRGGPIELFLIPDCSMTGVTKAVVSDGVYERILAANQKE